MRETRSYMFPKLVCLNMLALMMITFEHKMPAEGSLLLSTAQSGERPEIPPAQKYSVTAAAPITPAPESSTPISSAPMQLASAESSPAALKKTVSVKRVVHHRSATRKPHAMLHHTQYAAYTPVGCCFRGN